jgi:hypothetical protein
MQRIAVRFVPWLALCFVCVLTRAAAAADAPISDEARKHFELGVSHMKDPDGARYAEAYVEFRAAYAASPSWKILGNLGITAMKLERDGEAIEAFQKYLAESGEELDPDERRQVESDLKTLQGTLVSITLESAPDGATIVDERTPITGSPVVNRYGPLRGPMTIGVKAGRHRFRAELEGYEQANWELDAKAATQEQHKFQLEVVKAAPIGGGGGGSSTVQPSGGSGARIGAYVALGVGVVGLAAGTLFSLQSKSKADDADKLCGGDRSACRLDATSSEADRVRGLNDDAGSARTMSIVGFAVGGVGVAAGVTLLILSGSSSSESKAKASVTPWIGYRSAGVVGRF